MKFSMYFHLTLTGKTLENWNIMTMNSFVILFLEWGDIYLRCGTQYEVEIWYVNSSDTYEHRFYILTHTSDFRKCMERFNVSARNWNLSF